MGSPASTPEAGGRGGLWAALRRRPRRWTAVVAATVLVPAVWAYDALGYRTASRFEEEHAGQCEMVWQRWQEYRTWHPTRNWFRPDAARTEEERFHELELAARQQNCSRRLAELERRAADPDADAAELWTSFQELSSGAGELAATSEVERLGQQLQARRDDQLRRRSQDAYDRLLWAEQQSADLAAVVEAADRFLGDYPGTAHEDDVRLRRAGALRRLEERDIEPARNWSARQPTDFARRHDLYQLYLDKHPAGTFAAEATAALRDIGQEWDRHDFRAVREQFTTNPGAVEELVARCQTYRNRHPAGQFVSAVTDVLRWTDRVTAPGEYRVVLRNGRFERGTARFFSRGPDLSVELEVGGVRYGPSNIVVNRYDPEWNYEFPRRVRWRRGDPVRIRVTDHDYWSRVVLDVTSAENEPLGLQLLTGEVWCGKNWVAFESDFRLPTLPVP